MVLHFRTIHEFKSLWSFRYKYSYCNNEFENNQEFKAKHNFIIVEYQRFWWMIKYIFLMFLKSESLRGTLRITFEKICIYSNFFKYLWYCCPNTSICLKSWHVPEQFNFLKGLNQLETLRKRDTRPNTSTSVSF